MASEQEWQHAFGEVIAELGFPLAPPDRFSLVRGRRARPPVAQDLSVRIMGRQEGWHVHVDAAVR